MNAHNILGTCCGAGGNIFSKLFHKDEDEDQQQQSTPAAQSTGAKPAAATATAAGVGAAATKPFGAKKFGFTDKQAKYEDVKWSKLPLGARKAAKAIGFEEKSWDDAEWIAIDDKWWEDLTEEEKTACESLGWDKHSWDEKYEHQAWADMPKHVQKAAEKLGWDQEKWDDDWDTDTWGKSWADFTPEEKRCLHVLGYYIHSWD